jgi:hypothetical protein
MGLTQAGMGFDGFGTKISLDLNGREKYDKQFEKIAYLLQNKEQFWSANDYANWMRFREHADSLKELENLPEQERLEEQKILEEDLVEDLQLINAFGDAVHEFGHAMHATATMKHMGIDPEDDTLTVVNKILGENFQDEDEALRSLIYRTGHYAYTPLEFLERAAQAVFGKSKSPYSKWFMAEWQKFYDVEGEEESEISLLSFFLMFRNLYGVDQESLRKKFDVFDHGHDDLPAEEVRKSIRQAKLISEYGGKDLQGLEAVAEWVTFRVLTGQYKTGENGPTWRELKNKLRKIGFSSNIPDPDPKFEDITDQTFLNWATGGKIKQENDDDFNEFVIQNFCTGELAESAGIVSDPKKLAEFRNGAKPSRKKRVILSKQLLGQIEVEEKGKRKRRVRKVGRAIGVQLGIIDPDNPQDGDGDGFYTAFEGAEDDTPVPLTQQSDILVTGSSFVSAPMAKKPKNAGTQDLRWGAGRPAPNQNKIFRSSALSRIDQLSELVRRKHKNIETNAQMRRALQRTFPNLISNTLVPDDDDKIDPNMKEILTGVMASALMDPVMQKWVVKIGNQSEDKIIDQEGAFGSCAFGVDPQDLTIGIDLKFDMELVDKFSAFAMAPELDSYQWRVFQEWDEEKRLDLLDTMFSSLLSGRALVASIKSNPELRKFFLDPERIYSLNSFEDYFSLESHPSVKKLIKKIEAFALGLHESAHARNFSRSLTELGIPTPDEKFSAEDWLPFVENGQSLLDEIDQILEGSQLITQDGTIFGIRLSNGTNNRFPYFAAEGNEFDPQRPAEVRPWPEDLKEWTRIFLLHSKSHANHNENDTELMSTRFSLFFDGFSREEVLEDFAEITDNVSDYAKFNRAEFIAETLTALALGSSLTPQLAASRILRWAALGEKKLSSGKSKISNRKAEEKPFDLAIPPLQIPLCTGYGGKNKKLVVTGGFDFEILKEISSSNKKKKKRRILSKSLLEELGFDQPDWRSAQEVKIIGTPIGGSDEPHDGDGDGICFEGRWDRRPIPCPPGVPSGRVIRTRKGKNSVVDLPGTSKGTDPKRLLPKEYMTKADNKLKRLGLTKGKIKRHTRNVLKQVNPIVRNKSEPWYPEVAARLERWAEKASEKYGKKISFEDVAAVMAALSPVREFTKNLRDGRRLIEIALADEEFVIDSKRIRGLRKELRKNETMSPLERFQEFERTHPPGKPLRPSDFGDEDLDLLVGLHPEIQRVITTTGIAPIVSALQILRGFDVDKILTGPKVRSFYSNLIEPDGDRVTIDTWLYRAMVPKNAQLTSGGGFIGTLEEWEKGSGNTRTPQALFQTTIPNRSGVGKNVGTYPIFAEVIRELAEEFDLSPAALQAILWNHIRIERNPVRNKPLTWDAIDRALGL